MNKIQEGVDTEYPIDGELTKRLENEFTYHAPIGDQVQRYARLRESAKNLAYEICRCCPDSRDRALALSQLKLATMLANSSIACNEELGE